MVVELFSSEGCSSCPPADVVLRDLSARQPVEGVEIIALEMHVDYWDDLGWKDPFSSHAYTSRQGAYTSALGDRAMYTPQMVVDGREGFVGSDRTRALGSIARAAPASKGKVELTRTGDTLAIRVSDLPTPVPAAEVLLALTEEGLTTDVKRGENAGAVLAHGPVVRSLKSVGAVESGTTGRAFEGQVTVPVPAAWQRDHVHAVVLVQARSTLAILGAAQVSLR